ncbi:glycoside hydrolase family 127 protein [bacterium]|nr:MAG: glycoside hydrolase family 127 protein [bacterium]
MKRSVPAALFFVVAALSLSNCRPQALRKADYPVEAVPLAQVDITDGFWAPKQEVNRTVSLWHLFKKYEEDSGHFYDTRALEGAAYMIAKRRDPALDDYVDKRIDDLVDRLESRITNPEYSNRASGNFLEAAVAYYEATGKRKMLDAAIKSADMMDQAYGPGKKAYISGHEGLKIGLIRLFRQTGDERYWKLAKFFLDIRGRDQYQREGGEYAEDRAYAQNHKPVVDQTEAVGHAVRATYLYIPLTDIAALTGQPEYSQADDKIWEDVVTGKMYLTGGIGSVRQQEKFGEAYELPNLSAWNETCAAYGDVLWNHRLFMLHRDAKYIDTMERTLYNGFLVGVSLKGNTFFYQNPLISYGSYDRFDWINVPCCPPNVVRLMASMGSYIYAQTGNEIYLNLFVGSQAEVKLDKNKVKIKQETRYPWDGAVKITVDPESAGRFAVYVRIPGWVQNRVLPSDLYAFMDPIEEKPELKVNGRTVPLTMDKSYVRLERTWKPGDVIELNLPMPVRKVLSHWKIQDDKGLVALTRGPLVYCAEWPDNGGSALNLLIKDDTSFRAEFRPELLNGVEVITGKILKIVRAEDGVSVQTKNHDLVAIPYYAWANRGMGQMAVWIPRRGDRVWLKPVPPDPIGQVAFFAAKDKGWTGYNDQSDDICAVYDGFDPLNSADESHLYFRMTPPVGKPAWIEYEFKAPTDISSSEAYFVDDRRFCRLPRTWRIMYKDGNKWKPVVNRDAYGVEKDRFNTVTFEPVKTKAVRLEVEPQSVLYKADTVGPPAAMMIDKDAIWREFGVIEWRVR